MNNKLLEKARRRGIPDNLYAAPKSMQGQNSSEMLNTSTWYHWHGRIGRVRYLSYGMIAFSFYLFISLAVPLLFDDVSLENHLLIKVLELIASLYSYILLTKRRLNDLELPVWLCSLHFVPYISDFLPEGDSFLSPYFYIELILVVVSIVFTLFLIFKKGKEGSNQYGKPPRPNRIIHYVLPVVSLLISMLLMYIYFEVFELFS